MPTQRARALGEAAVAALLVLLFVLALRAGAGDDLGLLWMENLVLTILPLAAALACWDAARRCGPGLRTPWLLVAAACAAWGFGSAVVTYITNIQLANLPVADRTVPVPGPADAGFLAFFPLAIAGILRLPQGRFIGRSRARTALDGLLIVASVLFVAWASGVGRNIELLGASALRPDLCAWLGPASCPSVGAAFGALNPLGDILLASVAFFVASFAPRVDRATLALLVGGFLCITLSDIDFSTRWLRQDNSLGNLLDAGWVAGFLLITLAARRPQTLPAGPETGRPTAWLVLAPYVPVAAAAVVAAIVEVRHGALEPFLFWDAFAVVMLMLARQAFTLLANQQLRHESEASYARLREAEQARSRLLHNITHDLRNPISPVLIQLRMLEGEKAALPPAATPRLAIIRRNVEQVRRLTEDLADVAKLEDGHLRLVPAPVDVRAVVADVAASFRPIAAEAGLTVLEETPDPLPVVADALRLRQVLANLVANAVKFTPAGQVALRGRQAGGRVLVDVQDTGRGLTQEEAGRLFQAFSQVHDPAEAKERGTGLGLYISRGLAQAHGGDLEVASEGRGKGCTFTLSLPAAPAAPAATA